MSERSGEDVLRALFEVAPGPVKRVARRFPRALGLARDAAMLVVPFVTRRRVARTFPKVDKGDGRHGDHALEVVGLRRETHDIVTVLLARPADFRFHAGQFLTLRLPAPTPITRSYSLSSAPHDEGPIAVTVKLVPGGEGSTFVHDQLREGHTLVVRGPSGSFTYAPDDVGRELLLIAGGSGITPIVSILRTALETNDRDRVSLVYAARSEADLAFREVLDALVVRHPERLRVRYFVDASPADERVAHGRPDREELDEAARGMNPVDVVAYVCGPQPMMDVVAAILPEIGIEPDRIRIERFFTPGAIRGPLPTTEVKLTVYGQTVAVPPGLSLLEAGAKGGLGLSSSCTMGGCGVCMMKLTSGQVALPEPNCLSPEERAGGLILPCIARPLTDVTLEDP